MEFRVAHDLRFEEQPKRKLSQGNCPYCDAENGINTHWGMSPEGFASLKKQHDSGHQEQPKKIIHESPTQRVYEDGTSERFERAEPTDWEKRFSIYAYSRTSSEAHREIKQFISSLLEAERERVEKLIVDEILICHKENTPTSRLTSLLNKIKGINFLNKQ